MGDVSGAMTRPEDLNTDALIAILHGLHVAGNAGSITPHVVIRNESSTPEDLMASIHSGQSLTLIPCLSYMEMTSAKDPGCTTNNQWLHSRTHLGEIIWLVISPFSTCEKTVSWDHDIDGQTVVLHGSPVQPVNPWMPQLQCVSNGTWEAKYPSENPFHNFSHGLDVAWCCHCEGKAMDDTCC